MRHHIVVRYLAQAPGAESFALLTARDEHMTSALPASVGAVDRALLDNGKAISHALHGAGECTVWVEVDGEARPIDFLAGDDRAQALADWREAAIASLAEREKKLPGKK